MSERAFTIALYTVPVVRLSLSCGNNISCAHYNRWLHQATYPENTWKTTYNKIGMLDALNIGSIRSWYSFQIIIGRAFHISQPIYEGRSVVNPQCHNITRNSVFIIVSSGNSWIIDVPHVDDLNSATGQFSTYFQYPYPVINFAFASLNHNCWRHSNITFLKQLHSCHLVATR